MEDERARARLLDAARVTENAGYCIVFNRPARECQCSVPEFNQRAQEIVANDILPPAPPPLIDTVRAFRKRILESFLDEAFRDRPGNPFVTTAEADADQGALASGQGLPGDIDSTLIARIFRDEWVSIVKAQNRMSFDIYAATDSGLIDSLARQGGKSDAWIPARVPPRNLPEDWIRRSEALVPGKWSLPYKTSVGFVMMRTDRRPPTLRESLPLLIQYAFLRMNTPARKRDTAIGGKAFFQISARLLPRPKGVSGRTLGSQRRREDSILVQAALRYPMRKLSSHDLPHSVLARLKDRDPFYVDFGYWWIDTAGIKSSTEKLPNDPPGSETDSLFAISQGILDSKRRDRVTASAEAAWKRDLGTKGIPEDKAKADWISANLEIRADFRD